MAGEQSLSGHPLLQTLFSRSSGAEWLRVVKERVTGLDVNDMTGGLK